MMILEVGVSQLFVSEIIGRNRRRKETRETLRNISSCCIVRECLATRKRNSRKEAKLKGDWSYGHTC